MDYLEPDSMDKLSIDSENIDILHNENSKLLYEDRDFEYQEGHK